MKKILQYNILKKLEETRGSVIYRARKEHENNTVIIKELKSHNPTPSEIARFRQEYEIIKKVDIDGVIKTYEILEYDNRIALVLEDFDGISLKNLDKNIELNFFLTMAIKLSSALGRLHKENIVHKDIKPHNLLWSARTNEVKIADFGISNEITHENSEINDPAVIEGTLVYMSPEQTGRMNRQLDYRTDMYSLGITFYELLTGSVPFPSKDPMEIIHHHIAIKEKPPAEVNPAVPKTISDIVMKLLSKMPEERYQNCFGLMNDLQECLRQLENAGKIDEFEPGKKDIAPGFIIPHMLIGREKEIDMLIRTAQRVSSAGERSEILLVSGQPGIGKSVLINEVHRLIMSKQGYFIWGKYEQYRRDVPYNAIIQAFQSLVRQVLSESTEKIKQWKNDILTALGPNGKIITDVIPEIELIIGEQPVVPELEPEQNLNRFNYVFGNFAGVLAARKHPVILFLDDLQWADIASINLINLLITDSDIHYFLIIGSYRDNEVASSHPLMTTLDTIKKAGVPVNSIHLNTLDTAAVNKIISRFLRCDRETSLPLAELVHKKTNGNPFFVNQFLKTLYDERLLKLDPVSGWEWEIKKIEEMQITDNVVELMAQEMTKLPKKTQEVMTICACMGNRFDLEIISKIYNRSIEETLTEISCALTEGMLRIQDDRYLFEHDRIQEAAYSLAPAEERNILHYRIGHLMLETKKEKDIQDEIINIVDHLNMARDLVNSGDETFNLARLNLRAGKKAKTSAAYESALMYLSTGIELINGVEPGESGWKKHYELSLSLYSDAAEAAYLYGDFEQMESFSDIVLNHAASLPDTVKIYEIRLRAYMAQNRLVEAIDVGLAALKSFGIKFPKKPNVIHIAAGFVKTSLLLSRKNTKKLLNLPMLKDPILHGEIRLLAAISTAAYMVLPELVPLIVFKLMDITIKYGNSTESPFSYCSYGMILCSLGKIDSGYEFGKLGLDLLERMNAEDQIPRTLLVMIIFVRHWKEHLRESLEPLHACIHKGLEVGDLEFAAHAAMSYISFLLYCGYELKKLEQKIVQLSAIIEKIKQKTQLQVMNINHQFLLNLRSNTEDPCSLKGEIYNEENMLPIHKEVNDRAAIATIYLLKLQLSYLYNEYQLTLENLENLEADLDMIRSIYDFTQFYFYDSLARLALYDSAPRKEQNKTLRRVARNKKKLKKWTRHNPSNQSNKYYLVEAERMRVLKKVPEAISCYEQSISCARENGFIQEEAIANECAAQFWLDQNKKVYAGIHLQAAYDCYSKWGAAGKVKQLEEKHGRLLNRAAKAAPFTTGTTTGSSMETLDFYTVMKAAQAISGEIVLEKLLKKMMKILLENGGAQKGFLILENESNKKLCIEAEGIVHKEIRVLESIPVEKSDKLSSAIVNYVNTSKKNLVLNNASEEGIFAGDPYIEKNRAKSILCGPITHQGKISGIIYLENNLTTNAFTSERLKLLRFLSSQAAISIDNARLVFVEKMNAALEKEIEMAREIQTSLLPRKIPEIKNAVVAYKYVPMMDVGGDFLDVHYDEENNRLCLFTCDVVGHGVYASLLASMTKIALQSWKKNNEHPKKILEEMWNQMAENIGDNFITACVCSLDLDTGKLALASAGHPPLIIVKKNGRVDLLKAQGMMMNNLFEPDYEELETVLQPGDSIILYTDGISEAANPDGEMIGEDYNDKFCRWIEKYFKMSSTPEELCENIYNGVLEHTGAKSPDDDFTILIARYTA
ncbi:MAG: SpoIIE family protein phosphatase [bacterium]|nr:SpoIIE family protein phosphatase [bacterium]